MKTTGIILIVAALMVVAGVAYYNSEKRQSPSVFAPQAMIGALWNNYKSTYVEASTGRTVDRQRDNVTTSEGQSYTMLRAVWQDDKDTFDASWSWTKKFLARPDDHLFSWLYGRRSDGNYGVLSDKGGGNSATDADTDIALALLFAHSRWDDPQYLDAAKAIIRDIWDKEVVIIGGKPYIAANDLEKKLAKDVIVVNPSYFAPYAYRIFAIIDPQHDWMGAVDTSYDILRKSTVVALDKSQSANVPPDWILLNKATGEIEPRVAGDLTTNYSYDALRIPWRIALDWKWNQEPRARTTLELFTLLREQWDQRDKVLAGYTHDGKALASYEVPAMYGGSLGYFLVTDPEDAKHVYEKKLRSLFNPDKNSWKSSLSYYDDNWAWFGLALYHDLLPNLLARQPGGSPPMSSVVRQQ